MEKLKPYLVQLKKHHFWVLSTVVAILGLTGWLLASSRLEAVYKERKTKIDGQFGKVQAISSNGHHPSEQWKPKTEQQTDKLKGLVGNAWAQVYAQQKNEVLKWPKELGDVLLETVQALGPTDEIPVNLREIYQNYVKEEFPHLLKIVDAQSYTARNAASVGRPRPGVAPPVKVAGEETEHDYKVIWDGGNQQEIEAQLDWTQVPSSQEMRSTQENLWVYRALLVIISRVNAGATGHYNAKIKDIDRMAIGQAAGAQFALAKGRVIIPAGPPGAVEPSRAPAPPAGPPPRPMSKEGAALAGVAEEGRYVDAQGVPLGATSAPTPEFKRMPVFLRLVMDQRDIHSLLVECANSPLPVEVRQLRINPDEGRSGTRGGPAVVGPAMKEQDPNPYDLPIELHGIIYIFNQPDAKKLAPTTGAAPVALPVEGAPSAAPPAAEPAAAVPAAEPAAPPAAAPAEPAAAPAAPPGTQ